MNSVSFQVQAADSSEQCSSVSGPSDTSNGTTTASESLPPESKTESCPMPPYSAISKHSSIQDVQSFTEGLRMSLLEDSRAKTSVVQDQEKVSLEKDQGFGNQWPTPFASLDPVTSLWKTPQCSLFEGLEPSLEIWPRWGLMHDGECFLLPIAEKTSLESAFLLPAPLRSLGVSFLGGPIRTKETWADTSRLDHRLIGIWKQWGGRENNARLGEKVLCHPTFAEWVMGLPTHWTDLKPLEICNVRLWLQQHGGF
jgi:hypothetical protein